MPAFYHNSDRLPNPFNTNNYRDATFEVLFTILEAINDTPALSLPGDIMASLDALTADVATLQSSVADAKATLDSLHEQVVALSAGDVSQADIDALDASVKAASDSLNSSVAADSAPAAPVAPVADPAPAAPVDAPVDPAPAAPVDAPVDPAPDAPAVS